MSTLRHYLQALWRRKWVVLAPLVLIPLVTLAATLRQQALYDVYADVLVNRQEAVTTSLIGQTPALDDVGRTMDTQVRLARVDSVIDRTLEAEGVTGMTTGAFRGKSSVFPLADIMRFTVSDRDPARAARLASAYAREFVRFRRELDTVGLAGTLEGLRDQIEQLEAAGNARSPAYVRLVDREQQLESLKSLRLSNVSVVQTAKAEDATQIAPRPRRNAAVAVAAGLVVGLILAFLWESLSTKPRSEEEFEALLGMPFLARLSWGSRGNTPPAFGATGVGADAAHALRTNLELANVAIGARTIMITSPRAGEGTSGISMQLAVALARVGRHVAVVDLDLRESSLTRLFGLADRPGVTTVAQGECKLEEALVVIPTYDAVEGRVGMESTGGEGSGAVLEVLGSGALVAHPAELLSSNAVAAIMAELERRADIVLIEVPPLLEPPDAGAIAQRVDGLLLVVSTQISRGPTLAAARRVIETWPVAKLGFAIVDGGDDRPYFRPLRRAKPSARTPDVEPERVAA